MNPHLSRALLLIEQNRHDAAQVELRQALAENPNDAYAHALLAQCLAEAEDFEAATAEVNQAIHLAPDLSFCHYVLARILSDRNHIDEALLAIREAIRLDPGDADYHAMEAGLRLDQKNWSAALAAAEKGLENEPEHVTCTNLRAMALRQLGREDEAHETIRAALSKDPDNAVTHANQGWALLQAGKPKEALEHFREALRLDPENEWARAGIVEALKARNIVYAAMLKYFFFMSRLSSGAQWGIIIAGYIGNRMLGTAARNNPDLAPWILPFRIAYIAFVVLTWTAYPLFNLMLRLNRFGRLALTREQIVASNWIGAAVGLALLCLAGAFFSNDRAGWSMAALVFGGLVIPLAGTFNSDRGWPRNAMAAYTAIMAAAGIAGVALRLSGEKKLGPLLFGLFLIGLFLSGWVANFLATRKVKR